MRFSAWTGSSSPCRAIALSTGQVYVNTIGDLVDEQRINQELLSTPSAQAGKIRARRANACAVSRCIVSALNGSRTDSLNMSSAFGESRIAASRECEPPMTPS